MDEPFRFQFSLVNGRIVKHLQAIAAKRRALYVEMALDAWFNTKQYRDAGRAGLAAFAPDGREGPVPVRFRLTISNRNIVQKLRTVIPGRRSLLAEIALHVWMESTPGKKAFEFFAPKNANQSVDDGRSAAEDLGTADLVRGAVQTEHEEKSDAERLIENALKFE